MLIYAWDERQARAGKKRHLAEKQKWGKFRWRLHFFPGFSLLNCCDLKWLNCKKGSSTLFIFRFYIFSNWWHCTNMKIVWHARSLELRKWLSSPRFLKGSLPRFPGSTKSQRRQRCQIYRPIIHSWRICPNRSGQSDHNHLTSICCAFDAFFLTFLFWGT